MDFTSAVNICNIYVSLLISIAIEKYLVRSANGKLQNKIIQGMKSANKYPVLHTSCTCTYPYFAFALPLPTFYLCFKINIKFNHGSAWLKSETNNRLVRVQLKLPIPVFTKVRMYGQHHSRTHNVVNFVEKYH